MHYKSDYKVVSLLRGFPKLVMKLKGVVANELQNVMAEIASRYRAGDASLIKEIVVNSQKTDVVTVALKGALAAERIKKRVAEDAIEVFDESKYAKLITTVEQQKEMILCLSKQNEMIMNTMMSLASKMESVVDENTKLSEVVKKVNAFIEPSDVAYEKNEDSDNMSIYSIANKFKLLENVDIDTQKKIRAEVGQRVCDTRNPEHVVPTGKCSTMKVYLYNIKDFPYICKEIKEIKHKIMDDNNMNE